MQQYNVKNRGGIQKNLISPPTPPLDPNPNLTATPQTKGNTSNSITFTKLQFRVLNQWIYIHQTGDMSETYLEPY